MSVYLILTPSKNPPGGGSVDMGWFVRVLQLDGNTIAVVIYVNDIESMRVHSVGFILTAWVGTGGARKGRLQ